MDIGTTKKTYIAEPLRAEPAPPDPTPVEKPVTAPAEPVPA